MNPWHLSSRTLAASYNRLCQPLLARGLRQWQAPQLRSYTTALNESLRDKAGTSPLKLPAIQRNSLPVTFEGAVGDNHAEDIAEQQAKKQAESAKKGRRRRGQKASVTNTSRPPQDLAWLKERLARSLPGKTSVKVTANQRRKDVLSVPVQRLRERLHRALAKSKKTAMLRKRAEYAGPTIALRPLRMTTKIKLRSTSGLEQLRRRRHLRATRRSPQVPKSRYTPNWASLASITRPSAVHSSHWSSQFARIYRWPDEDVQAVGKEDFAPLLDPHVYEWLHFIFDELEQGALSISMDTLPHQSHRGQQRMFMDLSLWLLRYDPDRMIDFLRATHFEPYPPIDWIEDCLRYLAKSLVLQTYVQTSVRKDRLLDLFHILAHRANGERLRYMDHFVRKILPYCNASDVSDLCRTIKDNDVVLHGYTLLHLASRCSKDNNFDLAHEALLGAKDAGVRVRQSIYRKTCSTVIRSCISQPDGLRLCLRIVSELVDIGVELNGPICDIIMLNAVDAGDINTAFAVYRSLVERGLQPRESTFAILLKGCKLNIDDADMLNGVIRDAISQVNVRQSVLVATEILHCLALHHTKHNPDTALRTITEAYAQLFDTHPLQLLGLPLPSIQQQRATTEPAMTPSPHALGFMISASIQRIQSYSTRPDDIADLYARWREHVESHTHPALSELAVTDHTSNIFLMAFIRTPAGLIHAARVVRDMQRDLPPPPPETASDPAFKISEQCRPTVQTWSIFLHGFTRHGKTKLAEQVLTYMRGKGIEPNEVTWNTLILGYARTQDVERTFKTLRRAERSGYIWDRWTEDAVGWLRDRGKVAREIESRRRAMEGRVDFGEDLKSGLGEKLSLAEVEQVEEGEVKREDVEVADVRGGEARYSYVPQAGFAEAKGQVVEPSMPV